MLKLQDFARECGVTDRAIQKHIQKYSNELQGHFERHGRNGTWLDEYAQDFIRGKIKQNPIVVGDGEQLRELVRLQERIEQLERQAEKKEDFILKLLDDANLKQERISSMEQERLLLQERTQEEIRATEDRLTLQYRGEISRLEQQLEEEKKRPLSLKERLTGRKIEK